MGAQAQAKAKGGLPWSIACLAVLIFMCVVSLVMSERFLIIGHSSLVVRTMNDQSTIIQPRPRASVLRRDGS